jgi:hypothetical protein
MIQLLRKLVQLEGKEGGPTVREGSEIQKKMKRRSQECFI